MYAALVRLFERQFDSDEALAQAVAVLRKAKTRNASLALVHGTGKLCMSHAQYFAIPQSIFSKPGAGSMLDLPDDAVPVEPPTTNPKHFMGPSEQIAKIMSQRLDMDKEQDFKIGQSRGPSRPRNVRRDQVVFLVLFILFYFILFYFFVSAFCCCSRFLFFFQTSVSFI